MLEKVLEEIERLHIRILKDKFAEKVTEQEIEALVAAKEIIRKHMNDGWIPVEERLPEDNKYILLSFENFSLPEIGRYEAKEDGGAFYLGECDEGDTCISQDLYVNAWQPVPPGERERMSTVKFDELLAECEVERKE